MKISIIIIFSAFIIEYHNKLKNKATPLHTIPKELFFFFLYISNLIHHNSNDNKIIKYPVIMSFWLHLARLIIYNKKLLIIPLYYHILGGITLILYFSKYTLILEPIIRLLITFRVFKIVGFNPIIDASVIFYQIYIIVFNYFFLKKKKIIEHYWWGNLIYHILEVILYLYMKGHLK